VGVVYHACGRYEMHTKFQLQNLEGRDHLGDIGVDDRIIDSY
jgi:hypothetical protein